MSRVLSVLIPAHDEASCITTCLAALFASAPLPDQVDCEVLVLANGCSDDTAALARGITPPEGWGFTVLEIALGGKLNALNQGEAAARGDVLIYLDADVQVAPEVMAALARALDTQEPRYAGARPQVAQARSWVTRQYARFWVQLPFVRSGVPGFGLFAMTRTGRNRWADWPDIISDDTFARLSFAPGERVAVAAPYSWPMVEGFRNLVRVRRRQNRGVAEIEDHYPQLLRNDDKLRLGAGGLARLVLRDPVGFAVYALIALAVKTPLFDSREKWARGR